MDKKLIVRQNGFKDCGPSCLLSIMKYYGCEASHEEVAYILKTTNDGTNAYNIINGARSFGFDGYGIRYSYDEIINNKINLPIICHVLQNNMYHFIVVYEVKNKYLVVMDPSSEVNKLSKEEFKNIYLGTSLVIFPIKKFNKIEKHKELLDFIIEYIKLEKKSSIKVVIFTLIVILLSIVCNYYILICLDMVLPNYKINFLFKVSIIFLFLNVTKCILNYIKSKYLINIEKNISLKLNRDVIVKLFNLPYQFFKNKSTGEVFSRINDLKIFKDLLFQIIVNISSDVVLVLISMFILMYINFKLFFVNLIGLIIYFLIVLLYRKVFTVKTDKVLVSEGNFNKCLTDNINSYEINRNLNMINNSVKEIEINYRKYWSSFESFEKSLNEQIFFKDIIVCLIYIFSVFLGIIYINSNLISLGEFVLFNSIIYYFTDPIKNILDLEPNLNYIRNIYNRINDLLMMNVKSCNKESYSIKGDINIKDLSYAPDGYNYLFRNISFDIKYGSKFLIYGDSGNGKSTIIKILLKYLEDYRGYIYINDINLKDINDSVISENITYVSQNSYISSDTFINSIFYGREVDINQFEKILKICNLNKLRDSKTLRNNFIIEDNGFNISGGERQKIILARSLLKNSNYLILDEALSEVDFNEEIDILNKIFLLFDSKTIIYISHKKEIIDYFKEKYKLERSERLNVS